MIVDDGQPQTVINHNPLPDLTHADFVQLLGPLLAPENYVSTTLPSSPPPTPPSVPGSAGRTSPAPLDWLHVDARNARTALANLAGVHSLAAERGWRQYCVLSLDLARLPPDADAVSTNLHGLPHQRHHSPFLQSLSSLSLFC
jgi:hypothetical protein